MQSFIESTKKNIITLLPSYLEKVTLKEILYRSINFLLLGWIFSFYIYIPFLVYMSNNGFFSYDLFNNGLFAINVFSLFIAIILMGISIMISGGFGLRFVCKKNQSFKLIRALMLLNSLVNMMIISFIYYKSSFSIEILEIILWFLFLFLTSLIISIHIGIMIFGTAKSQFFSLILIFIILLPILFFNTFPKQTSKLTSIAFKVFNIGGNVKVIVKNKINKEILYTGELIFLSPENIFLKENENKIILERKDLEIIFPYI